MSHESLVSLASSHSSVDHARQPKAVRGTRSFSRLEPSSSSPLSRSRSSTLDDPTTSEVPATTTVEEDTEKASSADVFERASQEDADGSENPVDDWLGRANELPEGFDEMPIELISLTDRFIESLSAKVWPRPPTIDMLSTLFQDFYVTAASRISTHISTLSSRQHRQRSPAQPISSRSSSLANSNGRATSTSSREQTRGSPERSAPEQQMLTTSEIADRRRARRLLEQKRVVLEEAVERRACEGVYDRIWRHRSSHDEEQDEKLRSKTAALALVGIGLEDLGIGVEDHKADGEVAALEEDDVREWLAEAREELTKMNDEKYPLGKLTHLKAAHKSIVDSLSRFHPSSSSADEILPTLIYTLITTPAEGINIISNFLFVQRFRTLSKIDGEAAYCLTNLEAAIAFLETVDLASLRADEAPSRNLPASNEAPSRALPVERTSILQMEKAGAKSSTVPDSAPSTLTQPASDASASLQAFQTGPASFGPSNPASSHQRRLSSLIQTPTNPFGAASDAVLSKADQSLRTVSNTLENSYRFLFGRLQEHQLNNPALEGENSISVPKTLDEARRLVSTPPHSELNAMGRPPVPSTSKEGSGISEKGIAGPAPLLQTGQDMTRDRSADSTRSAHSAKRVGFASDSTPDISRMGTSNHPTQPLNPAVESIRILGNSLNPLNRFAGMNMMRPFGRSVSTTPPVLESPAEQPRQLGALSERQEVSGHKNLPETSVPPSQKKLPKTAPPLKKFMELENPGDLKIGEVLELLRDYRRLASALEDAGAC